MDGDSTITEILLGVAVLAFATTHVAERVLQMLRRGSMREKVMGRGIREAAARHLWSKRYAYAELLHILRITAIAAAAALAFALLSNQLNLAWPYTVAAMLGLWAVLVWLRPVMVKLAERMPDAALLGMAIPLLLLWPGLPLAWFSYRTMQMGRRAVQSVTGDGVGPEPRAPEEEETVEERITEEPLAPEERRMIGAILQMEDTMVREIMRPRVDVVALDVDTPLDQAAKRMVECGHSRVPVFQETLDNVLGILHSRDLLAAVAGDRGLRVTIRDLVRPSFFVPESKRVDELLREFQERRVQMGIVIDEYGGVEGIVTIEDLLEEIVGELEDEFQAVSEPIVQRGEGGAVLVDARIKMDDFNAEFNTHITGEGFETLAGFLYSQLGKIPNAGDLVAANGLQLEVVATLGRRIKQVKVLVAEEDQKTNQDEPTQERSTSSTS